MKQGYFLLLFSLLSVLPVQLSAQGSAVIATPSTYADKVFEIPELIPHKVKGKYGYVNRSGKMVIPAEYSHAGFFLENCNLANSPNPKAAVYATGDFAFVRQDGVDYRIDKKGKRVYVYREEDMGKCPLSFKPQIYHVYVQNGFFGLIEDAVFRDPKDFRQYRIFPQYQYLHLIENDDVDNPLLIAGQNNRFGIIDKNGVEIIPLQYADIKPNFSWKQAHLFEVSLDGKNYFFIDINNKRY